MSNEKNQLVCSMDKSRALEAFNGSGISKLIREIETEVRSVVPDLSTAGGRASVKSLAYKISRSKVFLDDLGKDLAAEWKIKTKLIDNDRKKARDSLDALRDEVRLPLAEWEETEKAEKARLKIEQEIIEVYDFAVSENKLFDREKAMQEKEAAIQAKALEIKQAEERQAAKERDAVIAETARKAAIIDAENSARAEREQAKKDLDLAKKSEAAAIERAEKAVKEAEEKAKRDAVEEKAKREAIEAAAEATRKRQIKETEERVKREAKAEAARVESQRLAAEKATKEAARLASEDKERRRAVNSSILKNIVSFGIDQNTAMKLIGSIANGKIENLTINY